MKGNVTDAGWLLACLSSSDPALEALRLILQFAVTFGKPLKEVVPMFLRRLALPGWTSSAV